jgi:heterodisulfide reductase subunit B
VERLGRKLLLMARQAAAQCIVVACPLCQLNLDLRQSDAAKSGDKIPATPILYVTQILGLALGIPAKELGLDALSVSADSLLSEVMEEGAEPAIATRGAS